VECTTAYGELFLGRKRDPERSHWEPNSAYPRFIEAKHSERAIRPLSTFRYLDGIYRHSGTIGLKLMYYQLRKYPEILPYLIWNHIYVIHLVRLNHLDALISYERRKRTGLPHQLIDQQVPASVRFELSPEKLINRIKSLEMNIERARKLLRWSKLTHLEVSYENLLKGPSFFDPIWDFLSINPERILPQSNLVKIQQNRHETVISNYKQVKAVLAGTPYESLLE
jgi:hypothetical protein